MNTRNISGEGTGGKCAGLTTLPPPCADRLAISSNSWNHKGLELACTGIALLFNWLLIIYNVMCVCACVRARVYILLYIYTHIHRNSQIKISTQIILRLDKVYHIYNFLLVSTAWWWLFYRWTETCSFTNLNLFYTKTVVTDDTLIAFV